MGTEKELDIFIKEHKDDDIQRLLLSSSKYPSIDIKRAAEMISALRKISKKVPSWIDLDGLHFPSSISAEQSSSELTATYKQRFVNGGIVADLTGGMGVDSYFLSKKAKHLFYFERNPELCEACTHNFKVLGTDNISAINIEMQKENISTIKEIISHAGLIYIDPSRRADNKKRVYALSDYQPDILEIKDDLFSLTDKILVKVSPLVDISATIRQIAEICEIHVISINNECKELLLLLDKNKVYRNEDVKIFTVNYPNGKDPEYFNFLYGDEAFSTSEFSGRVLSAYLYEPNSSILKAGAFKTLGKSYNVRKLHTSTHLYTSDTLLHDFPGRIFRIEEQSDFKKEIIKNLRRRYPKANISTRNFPMTPEELKKMLKINDGGEFYIFGCTINGGNHQIVVCTKTV